MWWTPSIVKSSYCLLFESRVMAEELAILEISICPRWSWGPIISGTPCFLGLTDGITNRKKQSIFLIISGGWRTNKTTGRKRHSALLFTQLSYLCTLNWARPQVLPKLGMNSKVRVKIVHWKKEWTKLVFWPKLVLKAVLSPILDLPYLCLHCCSYSSLKNQVFLE